MTLDQFTASMYFRTHLDFCDKTHRMTTVPKDEVNVPIETIVEKLALEVVKRHARLLLLSL